MGQTMIISWVWDDKLNVLGKTQKRTKLFLFRLKKRLEKLIKENENIITITYKIKFIDSTTFMATSLSNLVDNLEKRIHKIKNKDCDFFLEYKHVKNNLIKYKCLSCNKEHSNKIDEDSKKWFKNTFEFSNDDINKFFCC